MNTKKKMKNKGYFKTIAAILAFTLFSSSVAWAYGEYKVRSGRRTNSYDMNWAPNLMDSITMDGGEAAAYVGKELAITAISLGAGYAAKGLCDIAKVADMGAKAAAVTKTVIYAGTYAASGAINAGIMGGDVGQGALIGGVTGGITGGVGASGLGIVGGGLVGAGVGSGVGYLVDKDHWWVYGLQGAVAGGMAGYNNAKLKDFADTYSLKPEAAKTFVKYYEPNISIGEGPRYTFIGPQPGFWSNFLQEFSVGYATRASVGLASEAINTQVYLDTYDENTGKWDTHKAELYSAIGSGMIAGLINPGAVLGKKDIMSQAAAKGVGEVLLTVGEGALVGGLGGLAGGLLVQEVRRKDWINEDDFQYVSPLIYQLGSLAGVSLGKATFDPEVKGIKNILLAPVKEFASARGWTQLLGTAVKGMTQKELMDDLSPTDKDYQRRKGYAYILADTAGKTASIFGGAFAQDRGWIYQTDKEKKDFPVGSVVWGSVVDNWGKSLLTETLSPAVTLELNLAWKETGASDLSAAYYVNLATSGGNLGSHLNTLREGVSFGYRDRDYYTPLQWGSFVSNMQAIASPLTYPTRIKDTQTGEYRTDAYWVSVLNSGSEANINPYLGDLFNVKLERSDSSRLQNLPTVK